jgi:hypothetical protein
MTGSTRRGALATLFAASLAALSGCSERTVVVGPEASSRRRDFKGREEAESQSRGKGIGSRKAVGAGLSRSK